jgi:pimeloyl-ACP methyl ester carboxylesterase
MTMAPPVVAILIGGTGVSGPVAGYYYHRLASAFATCHVLTLPGLGHASLDVTAAQLLPRIDQLLGRVDPAAPVVVVGHSQGGLVALEAVLAFARIGAVHALAAPLQGLTVPLAAAVRAVVRLTGGLISFVPDLIAGSHYLTGLAARLAARPDALDRITVWGFGDDRLVPAGRVYLPGAANLLYGSDAAYAAYRRAYPDRTAVVQVPQHHGNGCHLAQVLSPDLHDWFAVHYGQAAGPQARAA